LQERNTFLYGEKDENGALIVLDNGNVKIPENKIAECNLELQELFNTEIEINISKLPIEIFETIEMTPLQAINLEPIVDFE
jgi:hypothetical protein